MDLIFVEKKEQVPDAVRLCGPGRKLIAFSPEVVYALTKSGQGFTIPEEYYQNDDLQKQWKTYVGISNNIISEVDGLLTRKKPELLSVFKGIQALDFNAQMFLNMFRQYIVSIFEFKRIILKEEPREIYYPENSYDELTYKLLYRDESVFSGLVPLLAAGRYAAKPYSWRKADQEVGSVWARTMDLLRKAKSFFLNGSLPWLPLLPGYKGGILVFHKGYDLGYVIWLLRKRGYAIHYFDRLLRKWNIEPTTGCYQPCFYEGSPLIKLFEYEGVNFFPLAERRMRFYLDVIFPYYAGMSGPIKRDLKQFGIRLVIGSHSPSRIYENILCACAQDLGIKVASFQHGCYGERFNHVINRNDFDNPRSDYFFSWGIGVEGYARKYESRRLKIIPVGSAWIDILSRKTRITHPEKKRKKIVLYIPTSMRINPKTRMLPGEFSGNRYYILQQKIVSETAKNPDIELWVKFHPNDNGANPLKDFLKDSRFNNCRITDSSVPRLFQKTDLVISDFMSTSLVQLLAMKKNAMFYIDDSALMLEPRARMMLDKCMYCFDDIDNFLRSISAYSRSPGDFPRKDNMDFLVEYGTYLNDGMSVQRSADSIDKILRGAL